ncbi:uncharacterized protein LOC127256350 [Andrographis paniculata]|uniref:uncharacterized protein LOC127256350 n=1 Tax=Andrographis paniculata TaxID=175694 RepID=UPI0021E726A9|nr:uncharacterized protein LOC127256350 [Andrographis paniculata]
MVKLASARESRAYGPRMSRSRSEYMNAGLYVFATVLLMSGFAAQFSSEPRSGLVLLLIGFLFIVVVNVHDLIAHLAGIDYRLPLLEYDMQLALVELAVPVVYSAGAVLFFLATLFLLIQAEKGYKHLKMEKVALSMYIAAPILWLVGSIHNSCQIYERSDSHVQILQETVLIPFLMSSLLFLVGSIFNSREQMSHNHRRHHHHHHGVELLGESWVWLGLIGSFVLFVGGLANVVKVFKMQQCNGLRLEKLRGGAHERLVQIREGQRPLIAGEDDEQRRVMLTEEQRRRRAAEMAMEAPTPYKDVLVGQT